MLATATDNAVVLFAIAALVFVFLFVYRIVSAPTANAKWEALLPAGLILMCIAFVILYHQKL